MSRYNGQLIPTAIRPDCKLGVLTTSTIGKHFAHEDGYDGYLMVNVKPQSLTLTERDFWCGNNLKSFQGFDETVTNVKLRGAKYVFPNLRTVAIGNETRVVSGLDTAFEDLSVTVVVPNTLLTDYQTAYASATNLTFTSWLLQNVTTIPYVGEPTLTADYVRQFAQTASGDPSIVGKIIVPVGFTAYESGSIDAIINAFPNMEVLTTTYSGGAMDFHIQNGTIPQVDNYVFTSPIAADKIDEYLVASRGVEGITSIGKNLPFYPRIDTSGMTSWGYAFHATSNEYIPPLDASSATDLDSFARNTTWLRDISLVNCGNVTNINNLWAMPNLRRIILQGLKVSLDLTQTQSMQYTRETLVELINSLGTPETTQTLTIGATNLAKLTAEDIAIATAKNWQVQ